MQAVPARRRHILIRFGPTLQRGQKLFVRNTIASAVTFGLDMMLLWFLAEHAGVPQLAAASVAFLVAITLHYVLSRIWVFRGSDRGVTSGYLYFLVNAGAGLIVTVGLFWLLLVLTEIHYLIARAIASVAAGLVVFLLNAIFNFKVLAFPGQNSTDAGSRSGDTVALRESPEQRDPQDCQPG